ncbi:uncharacterized protein [Chelonus insularis]|uniref:uncharacterized protein n=1 Tax=Chelonus insularis TaxID=460826 RepID=UPI0015884636|nr:uncharacterized protein LOC118073830 [Chelonus insularis]
MSNNLLEHFNNDSIPGSSSLPNNPSNANIPHENINRISVIKNLGERIRSSLPNIRNHLKRLIGLKNLNNVNLSEEKIEAIKIDGQEQIVGSTSDETVADSSDPYYEALNNDLECIIDTSSSSSSNYFEISIRPPNLYEYHTADLPSTSTFRPVTNDTSLETDRAEQRDTNLSTIFFPSISTTPLMISHSVNTSMDALTMSTIRNEDAAVIVAGNSMEFVATLYVPMGAESSERIILEPRRVPLFLPNNSVGTFRIGGIPSSGSESSSESGIISEFGETDALMRHRRNEERQLYDVAMRRTVRKPFLHLDDEPPIY